VSTPQGAERATKLTLTAKVVDLDRKQRLLTLRDHSGETQTIRVDEKARNLEQVKAGDDVVITYYQSTAFQVVPPGEMQLGVRETAGVERAAQGAAPGGNAASVTTVVADIAKLDREKQEAVLRGSEGRLMTVHVADPANFDKVQVGDRVQITLTEALAVDVQPAPPQ
jgi:antitoxin (DNA-binding transcriptional repressor) of toxin-antitoxin stability system